MALSVLGLNVGSDGEDGVGGEGPVEGPFDKRLMLRLWRTLCAIVSVTRAGEEGWSVTVTLWALENAEIREGRAVPVNVVH